MKGVLLNVKDLFAEVTVVVAFGVGVEGATRLLIEWRFDSKRGGAGPIDVTKPASVWP